MTIFRCVDKVEPIGLRPAITSLFDSPTWLRGKSRMSPNVVIVRANNYMLIRYIKTFIDDRDMNHLFIEATGKVKEVIKILTEVKRVEGEIYGNYAIVASNDIGSVYEFTRCYIVLSREREILSLRISPDCDGLKSWRRNKMGKETNKEPERLAGLSGELRHLNICAALARWEYVSGVAMPEVDNKMWLPWSYGIPFKVSEDRIDRMMIPEMAIKGWGLCLGSRDGITQGRLAI